MKVMAAIGVSLSMIALMGAAPAQVDPLLRPIAPDYAKRWLAPEAPVRVFGNTYLVGFGGLNVALVRTREGLILIDGAVPQAVEDIEANIRALGFSVRDVKLILSTEPHYDHAGGIAALARDSGATVVASADAAQVLLQGGRDPDDPQAAWLEQYPAVTGVTVVRDGDVVRLGGVAVTAVATPGHTPGSMSWRWRSCEKAGCASVLFASSISALAAPGWRFADHPERVQMFRDTFARLRAMPCDILLSAHPEQSGGVDKLARLRRGAKPHPFRDRKACHHYAVTHEVLLGERLADEKESHQ